MKKLYTYFAILAAAVLSTSCNNEWEDEQYEQYISFKAPIGSRGVTDIYVRYNEGGLATYKLPLIVSGSTPNHSDRIVHVGVDSDTLVTLNSARFGREDLYYRELDSKSYEFPETVNIPGGTFSTTMDIRFNLTGINLVNKWVLPLTIVDDPSYGYVGHPRKSYSKALLRVMPFNDYSGSYSTTTMQVFVKKPDGSFNGNEGMVSSNRTAYVVDENTVFFYAGLVDEELIERDKYKVYFRFEDKGDDNKVVVLSTDPGSGIKLQTIEEPTYSVMEIKDATRPYLIHRYTVVSLEYDYVDYTSKPGTEIPYKVKGTMTLERNINTQIPIEDQIPEW